VEHERELVADARRAGRPIRDPLRQGLGFTNQVAAAPRLKFVAMAAAKVRGERRRARTDLGDGGRGRVVGCVADASLDRPGFMDVERFDQTHVFARVVVEKVARARHQHFPETHDTCDR
jgi:hypothetical protein